MNDPAKGADGASEYRLELGDVVIGLRCDPPALAAGLARWFDRPGSERPPHIELDLKIVPHRDTPVLPNSLMTTKQLGPGGAFDISDGLITGEFDRASGRGRILAKAILAQGQLVRVLEQIFYQAFHSARRAAGSEAFLIHSSAVIRGGQGFLFVGPSEAGKSTVAKCSAAHHVLGDEMSLIQPGPDGLELIGTPFNGLFREKRPGSAPLRAVFLLAQAPAHRIVPAPSAEAATALAAEIVPPIGLDEAPGPDTLPALVDTAALLIDRVPVRRLEFLPDAGFWDVIDREFPLSRP